jgi:membrane dipeptidase
MNNLKSILLIAFLSLLIGCKEKRPVDRLNDEQLRAYANELAHQFIIMDGHVDLPELLHENHFVADAAHSQFIINADKGEFDYERAKKGGLSAPFMSIYIPSSYQKKDDFGKALADSLIDFVDGMVKLHPDKFSLVTNTDEVKANFDAGKISLPKGMENGAPIGNDLSNLTYFCNRGIRYITLTHSKNNQICDSSGDTVQWGGLSPFGKQVVKEMNRLGIMVDISHVDDSTFYQVMRLTNVPCIASHSSCRYFSPGARRDMTDDMIKALGKNGGVMLINFYTAFLDSATDKQQKMNNEMIALALKEKGLKKSDSLAKPIIAKIEKENPLPLVEVEKVTDHIDHVAKLIGVDHVGLGSDFDGVDGMLPQGLTDASMYPNLIYSLLKRGYTEDDIEKICSGNFFRVWKQVEEVAKAK